jgi:uncharacterized protein with PIN domain
MVEYINDTIERCHIAEIGVGAMTKRCAKCHTLKMCLEADKSRIKNNTNRIYLDTDSCYFCQSGGWEGKRTLEKKKLKQKRPDDKEGKKYA